jgi:hypothetical protein
VAIKREKFPEKIPFRYAKLFALLLKWINFLIEI